MSKGEALALCQFVGEKYEKSLEVYAQYNGFSSQIMETQEREKLNYMEMSIMAKHAANECVFWQKEMELALSNLMDIATK